MTFARSLRAILRQDPDVILIGEIRDIETAQIAVQASNRPFSSIYITCQQCDRCSDQTEGYECRGIYAFKFIIGHHISAVG